MVHDLTVPTLPPVSFLDKQITDAPIEVRFYGRRAAYKVERLLRRLRFPAAVGNGPPARITNLGEDSLTITRVAVMAPGYPRENIITTLSLPVRLRPGQTFEVVDPYQVRGHS